MKMTIDIQDFSTYVSSGRISNIFKVLKLKDIKFEEEKLLFVQKQNKTEELLSYSDIVQYAKNKAKDLYNKRKNENNYNLQRIIDQTLMRYINDLKIDSFIYLDNVLKEKNEIIDNHLVQEKLLKLKKLKQINL